MGCSLSFCVTPPLNGHVCLQISLPDVNNKQSLAKTRVMNRRSMVTVSLLSVDTRSCIWQISKVPLNAIFDCKLLQPFLQRMSLGTQFSCFLRFGDNLIQVQEWCSCSVMYTHSRPCDHCNTLITWNSSVNTAGNIIII